MRALPAALTGAGPLVRAAIVWGTPWEPYEGLDHVRGMTSGELLAAAGSLDGRAADVMTLLQGRLSPALLAMLDAERSDPGGRSEWRPVVQRHAVRLIGHSMAVEAAARRPLEALTDAGIPVLVLKGPGVARFHLPAHLRPFSDIDVLVPPSCFVRASSVLQRLGFARSAATQQPWAWFDRICIEGVNLQAGKFEMIDLHHHISPWSLSNRFRAEALLERSEVGGVGGVDVRLPSVADSLVIATLHVANDLWKGDPSLLSWRDIAVLSGRLGADGTDAAFASAGLGWLGPVVREALSSLATGSDPPTVEVPTSRARRQRRRLELLGWDADTFAARHPIGWAVRLPAARAAAFIGGHAMPSPAYARRKHGGYVRYWRTAASSLKAAAAAGTDYRKEPVARHRVRG